MSRAIARRSIVLKDCWYIRKLDSAKPDVQALGRELESPDKSWLPATMPTQVHEILLANGLIPDPHISKNAAESTWVGESDWAYGCRFPTPEAVRRPVYLRSEGLDTLVDIYLNGSLVASLDDMFLAHSIEVSDRLAPSGKHNTLLMIFSSPLRFIREYRPPADAPEMPGYKFLRKCHSDEGSYLGAYPHFAKVGIYRDVVLDVPDTAWIDDVWVRTNLSSDHCSAHIEVRLETCGSPAMTRWELIDPSGNLAASGLADSTSFTIDVDNPHLWWPRTHGKPSLYQLKVELVSGDRVLDARGMPVGIREVRPVLTDPDTGEKRFRFDVNGRPIFMRGANWAPLLGITHVWDSDRARRLLDLAEHADMNILRLWAEGHVPPQEFYDECDRRGIFIWQDFMFGYNMHPTGWPEFDEKCRIEIEDMIRRLRNHPCILLWSGGNENYMGWDFAHHTQPTVGRELFERIMPEACAKLDPGRLFHASSPYGGAVPNWPLEGDWHDYTTIDFLPDASVPLFASEMIRVSPPSLASMRKFLADEELWPDGYDPAIRKPGQHAWPEMWQYRSVVGSWEKIGPIEDFCDPSNAEELIRVLGTAHGEYLRERIERERRGVPDGAPDGSRRCWGNMAWRLNDTWPIIYSSVVDFYLEPKIAYYFLRRAYQPVLVSFERTPDRIFVWVVNDSAQVASGALTVRRESLEGKLHGELSAQVEVAPGEAKRCLDLIKFGPISLRWDFLSASFAGLEASYLLIGERYLNLPEAHLSVTRFDGVIEIGTDTFARQVTLQAEGTVFEDNYFDLPPGRRRRVGLLGPEVEVEVTIKALHSNVVTVT